MPYMRPSGAECVELVVIGWSLSHPCHIPVLHTGTGTVWGSMYMQLLLSPPPWMVRKEGYHQK